MVLFTALGQFEEMRDHLDFSVPSLTKYTIILRTGQQSSVWVFQCMRRDGLMSLGDDMYYCTA